MYVIPCGKKGSSVPRGGRQKSYAATLFPLGLLFAGSVPLAPSSIKGLLDRFFIHREPSAQRRSAWPYCWADRRRRAAPGATPLRDGADRFGVSARRCPRAFRRLL